MLPEYGQLPPDDVLDDILTERGLQEQIFNLVGYGLRGVRPVAITSRVRSVGDVMLVSGNAQLGAPKTTDHRAVLFSSQPGEHASGGACFIDSGGPLLWYGANTIAAVQTFGMNGICKGISGAYRIDRTDDLDIIRQFLP